jgi:mxaA protein
MHKFCGILLFFYVMGLNAYEDPNKFKDVDPKFVELAIIEPKQLVGYTVGDIIDRHITISIKKPYQLIEESLPIVGYEKRYQGQLLGMTLKDIQFNKKSIKDSVTYKILLKYQIFTNNVVAKPAFITADYYRLINPAEPDKIVKFRIPELTIATSPIAIFGAVKVEDDMSPFRGPLTIETISSKMKVKYGIFGFVISILTLFYIYSRYSWFPKQSRFFSHVYRQYKKSNANEKEIENFVAALHHGFNQTINQALFINNKEVLFKKNNSFKYIESEINDFFKLSKAINFEKKTNFNRVDSCAWLIIFSLHCRMCERGLIVDSGDIKKLGFK